MAAGGMAAATAGAGAGVEGYSSAQGSTMGAQSSGQNDKDWVRLNLRLLPVRSMIVVLISTL